MTSPLSTGVKGDAGVNGVGLIVNTQLGWEFRAQPVADVGIDAQIEPVADTVSTGGLLGVQIKAWPSLIENPTPDGEGWYFRESTQRLRHYWLRYRLPVILVLYDIEAHVAYWQSITEDTVEVTGAGFKVFVPRSQRLDAEAAVALARLARQAPNDPFDQQVMDLPPACADSLTVLRETAPALAQELAEALVHGRDAPGSAIDRVRERGTTAWPWLAWSGIAEYAAEYGLREQAAQCLIHGAERCDDEATHARITACAGMFLSSEDPEHARRLLTKASATPDGNLLAAVGLAALDHRGRTGPIPVPAVLAEHPEQATADATIQRFLADRAALSGDLDAAIGFHERALALAPRSPAQMLALAEALLRRRQPEPGATHLADYRRAALLARHARAARRRYLADSVPAATILLHALHLGGDERSAIRVAQPAPDGDAIEAEAESPGLAFYAARLCYETGDVAAGDQFEATIARSGSAEWITECAAVKASTCGASPEEQINRWQDFLATDAPDDHRLVALNQLAELGVWPLPELERLRDKGFLTEGTYDTVHAQALAATDRQPEALALLRRASTISIVAAEFYARQLAHLGHVNDSIQVCDEATLRFGDPRPELLALDVLTHAGRTDDVITRVGELLSRDDLPANLRHRVRIRIIEVQATCCDWLKCEKLARAGLAEAERLLHDHTIPGTGPVEVAPPALSDLRTWQRNYSWVIIFSQLHRNQTDEAFRTLTQLAPEPVSPADITAWSDLHRLHGWTPATAQQALTLATRDEVPLVVAAPIFLSLVQTCRTEPVGRPSDDVTTPASGLSVVVSEQFHQQLTEAWAAFLKRYPAAVRTLNSEDPRFAEQVRDLLLPHAIRYDLALVSVRAGRLPLGALSAASGTPYLLSLAQNLAGLIHAVTATPEDHERETNAARNALGATIAIEGSALYLAAAATQLWPAAIDAFLKILMPEPSARDVVRSHSAVRDSAITAGVLGADPRSGDLRLAPPDEAARLRELEATEKALQASQECRPAVVTDTATFGTSLNSDTISPWLAPVAVAIENNVALYSDDAHIRKLATYFGVSAFGSLALIEVLLDAAQLDAQAAEAMIEDLFRSNVVDLPNAWPLLARIAQAHGAATPPVLTNLTRTAFWQDVGEDHMVRVIATLAQHLEREPPTVEAFTVAAALGLTATFGPPDRVLAILGTILILTAADLSAESAEPTLRAIRQLASRHGWDPIPLLREQLIEALSDPDDSFAMSPENAEQTAARILGDSQTPRAME